MQYTCKSGAKAYEQPLTASSRVLDNLSGGIASSDRIDGLGKGIGEYLRSRVVDIPVQFLDRGWI